jgi:hypothetical protein
LPGLGKSSSVWRSVRCLSNGVSGSRIGPDENLTPLKQIVRASGGAQGLALELRSSVNFRKRWWALPRWADATAELALSVGFSCRSMAEEAWSQHCADGGKSRYDMAGSLRGRVGTAASLDIRLARAGPSMTENGCKVHNFEERRGAAKRGDHSLRVPHAHSDSQEPCGRKHIGVSHVGARGR